MTQRVVITGMSGITSLGCDWEEIANNFRQGKTGIRYMEEWQDIEGLNTRLGGPVPDFDIPDTFTRKQLRGAGRVSRLALSATDSALKSAGLGREHEVISNGSTGIAYGSSTGSVDAVAEFGEVLNSRSTHALNSTSYIRMMGHTTAVNISLAYGTKGRIINASSACTSGSLALGYAYEAIKYGHQKIMIAGGAEELDATEAAVFDTLYSTSLMNDNPEKSPRPFDQNRDGLVIGEGAATLILEEREFALARGARILAEITGFGTNSDGNHITQPTQATMEVAMKMALECAGIDARSIGYVSAHATATIRGDKAESHAIFNILGADVPVSSLKSFFGHSLGACGAIEAWLAICGMNESWFPSIQNLENVDTECARLNYIIDEPKEVHCETVMNNNFAFGGINTCLIFNKHN